MTQENYPALHRLAVTALSALTLTIGSPGRTAPYAPEAQGQPTATELARAKRYLMGSAQDPIAGSYYRELLEDYPGEAVRVALFAVRQDRRMKPAQLTEVLLQQFQAFARDRANLLAEAPDDDLVAALAATERYYSAIQQRSVADCGAVVSGGISAGQQSVEERRTGLEHGALILKGAAHAQRTPTPHRSPDEADWRDAYAAMRRAGGSAAEIKTLDEGLLLRSQPAMQCWAQIHMMRGLATLPAEQQARFAADMWRPAEEGAGDAGAREHTGPSASSVAPAVGAEPALSAAPAARSAVEVRDATEATWKVFQDPAVDPVWFAFARDFPDQARGAIRAAAERSATLDGPDMFRALQNELDSFLRANRAAASHAPDVDLVAYASASADLLRRLRSRGPEVCTGELTGERTNSGRDEDAIAADNRRLLAMLKMLVDARNEPVRERRLAPGDAARILDSMRQLGASAQVVRGALGQARAEDGSAALKCDAAFYLMQALALAPPDLTGRYLSEYFGKQALAPISRDDGVAAAPPSPSARASLPPGDETAAADLRFLKRQAGPWFARYADEFPDEALALVRSARRLDRNGGDPDMEKIGAEFAKIYRAHAEDVVRASDVRLQAVAGAMANYFRTVGSVSQEQCIAVALGSGRDRSLDQEPRISRALLATSAALFEAVVDGHRSPVERTLPTLADRALWESAFRRAGAPEPIISASLGRTNLTDLPRNQLCAAMTYMYSTLHDMAPAPGGRLTALYIRAVVGPRPGG